MAGIANERRMISRSPMGLVRCSAVWRIFADRRIVMSSSVLGSESCVNVKKRGGMVRPAGQDRRQIGSPSLRYLIDRDNLELKDGEDMCSL
jgi:hypothetical protein